MSTTGQAMRLAEALQLTGRRGARERALALIVGVADVESSVGMDSIHAERALARDVEEAAAYLWRTGETRAWAYYRAELLRRELMDAGVFPSDIAVLAYAALMRADVAIGVRALIDSSVAGLEPMPGVSGMGDIADHRARVEDALEDLADAGLVARRGDGYCRVVRRMVRA